MLSMMLDDIRGASSEIARAQGVDLVLNAQAEIVLYSSDDLDLTQQVIDELNDSGGQ
jgi:Skp family chaperone for outer membrane proteins